MHVKENNHNYLVFEASNLDIEEVDENSILERVDERLDQFDKIISNVLQISIPIFFLSYISIALQH